MRDTARQAADPADAGPDAGDDAALIARSLHAPECFGVLFDRHAPAIGRYIARRLGPDAADDLVAETFLVAFRRRDHYDLAHGDARPWLYGIATRLIGRHRREEVRFFRAIARTGVDPAAEPIADQVTDRIAAQAARRELAAALARLSQDQRDVLLLVASGLGYEETALALDGARRDGVVAAGPRAAEGSRGARRAGPHPPGRGCTVMDEMEQLEQHVRGGAAARSAAARRGAGSAHHRHHCQPQRPVAPSRRPRGPWPWRCSSQAAPPLAGLGGAAGRRGRGRRGDPWHPGCVQHGPQPGTGLQRPRSGAGPGSPGHRLCGRPVGYGDADPDRHQHRPRPDQDRERPVPSRTQSAIVFLPDGKTAYVLTNTVLGGGPGTVTPIRTATNTALAPITVGQDPRALAITPDGKTIYVTNYQSGTVTPIRTATNTALAPIKVGRQSVGHRDHPGRQDRLRRQLPVGHGDPDPDRHQHRPRPDQGGTESVAHRDHPGRQAPPTSSTAVPAR